MAAEAIGGGGEGGSVGRGGRSRGGGGGGSEGVGESGGDGGGGEGGSDGRALGGLDRGRALLRTRIDRALDRLAFRATCSVWDAVKARFACSASSTRSDHQSSPHDSQPLPRTSSRRTRPRTCSPAHENRSSTRSARIPRHVLRLGRGKGSIRVQRELHAFGSPKLTSRLPAVGKCELAADSSSMASCGTLCQPAAKSGS